MNKHINLMIRLLFIVLLPLLFFGCISNPESIDQVLDECFVDIVDNADENNIISDIRFINPITEDYSFIWSSSNDEVISSTGTVSRKEEDNTVIITVQVYQGLIYKSKNFTFVVPASTKPVVIDINKDVYTYDIVGTKSSLKESDLKDVKENESYNDYLDLISYIHKYHKLPNNYLTKNEASNLGWNGSGSNVWSNASLKGKYIGGDTFHNYEENLPLTTNNTYIELDVNCNKGQRGTKRIVYNRYTFDIYYTKNHYSSFTYMIGEVKDE